LDDLARSEFLFGKDGVHAMVVPAYF
jgi:hypothetical protein